MCATAIESGGKRMEKQKRRPRILQSTLVCRESCLGGSSLFIFCGLRLCCVSPYLLCADVKSEQDCIYASSRTSCLSGARSVWPQATQSRAAQRGPRARRTACSRRHFGHPAQRRTRPSPPRRPTSPRPPSGVEPVAGDGPPPSERGSRLTSGRVTGRGTRAQPQNSSSSASASASSCSSRCRSLMASASGRSPLCASGGYDIACAVRGRGRGRGGQGGEQDWELGQSRRISRLDGVVVQVEAKGDPLVVRGLRCVTRAETR